MVTGAYYPESSGAGLQCRTLIGASRDRIRFEVLTTTVDRALRTEDEVDGIPVHRVYVNPESRLARVAALPAWMLSTIRSVRRADIVHLHGFSAKSFFVIAVARALGKRVVMTLTSIGHDDAVSMRAKGALTWSFFRRIDRFISIGPRFGELHAEAALPPQQLMPMPNGVDLDRFRPPGPGERERLRRELGLPVDLLIVLFVGFFSHEKRPDVAFEAWTGTFARAPNSAIVFLGRTDAAYYEIDPALAAGIRRAAGDLRCLDRVTMVEHSHAIEKFYRAADILLLPTTREGLPNVVLEAMGSGLPCVVSRLPGVTEQLIADGRTGVLVDPDDRGGYAEALARLLNDAEARARIGAAARQEIVTRYALPAVAAQYVALTRELLAV